jgi:hypothetical protein
MIDRSTSLPPRSTTSHSRSPPGDRARPRSLSPSYRLRSQRSFDAAPIRDERRRTRSRGNSRSRSHSPSRDRKRYRPESFYSDDSQWTPPCAKRGRRDRRYSDSASIRSSPRYEDYDDLPPASARSHTPTGPSNPLATQYIEPSDFVLTHRRQEDGFTAAMAIPKDYYVPPLQETHDLRNLLKRGNVIALRQVEFSYVAMNEFRTDYAFTSQGPVSVKWMRPFIIWEAYPRHVLGWWCRSGGRKGLKTSYIDRRDYYKYLGLSTTGDGRGNDSPHVQMKINQRQGKVVPSHVFAPELVRTELATGWQFWGDVEPQSMWRLDALREVCTNLRTAVLDNYLVGLGLDIDALEEARKQLPIMRPGYERPPRGLPFQ